MRPSTVSATDDLRAIVHEGKFAFYPWP